MSTAREGNLIAGGEQIARRSQITPGVGASVRDLRCSVQCCPATDNHGADRLTFVEPARQIDGRTAVEIESSARKTKRRPVHNTRREHMVSFKLTTCSRRNTLTKLTGLLVGECASLSS